MPRRRPPYLHRYHTRHGKHIWYVRKPGGHRIRIRAEYDTDEFWAAYNAAIAGTSPAQRRKASAVSGSLRWLWDRYRDTPAWRQLSVATRKARENIMRAVLDRNGDQLCRNFKRAHIVEGRDRRAATPSQGRVFLDTLRGLFGWAVEALPDYLPIDPTAGVKNPREVAGEGFPIWTEGDVANFEKRWPLGTRERVWMDVLLYSGLRRGDAVRAGKQHVQVIVDPETGAAISAIVMATEKSGGAVTVTLPILPDLARTLEIGPCADLAFISNARGEPFTKESFGNAFRGACRKAGVNGKSAHGLRKLGATRAADRGASLWQMKALFGWTSDKTPAIYTRNADRRRASLKAMWMLGKETSSEQIACQPDQKVGTSALKLA